MAEGLLIVHSHPAGADTDEEMNRWYSDVHIPEVLRVPGIVGASRYRAKDPDSEYRYLATYRLEGDDIRAVVKALVDDGPNRTPSDAIRKNPPSKFVLYEFIDSHTRG